MNIELLKLHLPKDIFDQMSLIVGRFEINTENRMTHFLGQCAHESGNFTVFTEGLNYSAEGLRRTFPKYFPSDILAADYARKSEKIANRVYANRMGNLDELSGDGYKYKGRGAIQLTGKANYLAFGVAIGVDLLANPDLVRTQYCLVSGAWFFWKNKLNEIADKGVGIESITSISKRVNGGIIGLEDRIKQTDKFQAILTIK